MSLAVERPCANCGAVGNGTYCSNCGRKLQTRMPSVGEMFVELREEVLGAERRALLTLRDAIARPGLITETFRRGDGGKYVSPLKLYLSTSAIYFALALATGSSVNQVVVGDKAGAVRMDVVVALSVPFLAAGLKFLYGVLGGLRVSFSESASLTLALLSTLFAFGSALIWLPSAPIVGLLVFAYGIWYVWQGARRLWGERGFLGPVRAALVVLIYTFFVVLTAAGAFTIGLR